MTISTTVGSKLYTGNATTTIFPFTFKIIREEDLVVVHRDSNGDESTLTLDVDYSVSGVGDDTGGNVVYPISGSPLPSGEKLSIKRVVDIDQETNLANRGAYNAETIEDALDYLTMQNLQQQEEIDRSAKVDVTSGQTGSDLLSNLTTLVNDASTAASTASAAATAAAASATTASGYITSVFALQAVASGGNISHTDDIKQVRRVKSNGGALTASNTPFGVDDTDFVDGMEIHLEGESNTDTLAIAHYDSAYGCLLNGDMTLGKGGCLTLRYNANLTRFIEVART